MYKDGYVPDTSARLGIAYKAARQHMEEARILRENYYNRKTLAREFVVGDRCLVHFDATLRTANRKFIKMWKGVYRVTDVVGNVNLKLRATPQSKPILVHVNWVKHLKQNFPRLTGHQARQLNLQVSAEGLPPRTRQKK